MPEEAKSFDGYIKIQLQDGPIGEAGVNGCQIDDVLHWCKLRLKEFHKILPDMATELAIHRLEDVLEILVERTRDRVARGVEGSSAA